MSHSLAKKYNMTDPRHDAGYADTRYLALAADLAREDKRASYAPTRVVNVIEAMFSA